MKKEEFLAQWSALHGGAKIEGIVKIWLGISFHCARALATLRISPNLLTLVGLISSIALFLILLDNPGAYLFAILLLALSLAADGIDGSLAIISRKSSRAGAHLDALADRISESFWALALYLVGGDFRLILAAWLLASIQEYIRARSAGLGFREIGVVTICERPVRAIAIAIAFISLWVADLLNFELSEVGGPLAQLSLASWFAFFWLVMQGISIVTLWKYIVKNMNKY